LPPGLTFGQAIRYWIAGLGVALTVAFFGTGVAHLGVVPAGAPAKAAAQVGLNLAGVLPALWLVRRRRGCSWSQLLPLRLPTSRQAAALALAQAGATMLIHRNPVSELIERLLPPSAWLEELLMGQGLLGLVVLAPLLEEALCRGAVLGGLAERYPSRRAMVYGALFFALKHLNPWQLVAPFGLGLLYGWFALRTRSLILPILGHAAHNGAVYLARQGQMPGGEALEGLSAWTTWPVGGALLLLGLWMARRSFREPEAAPSAERPAA
jgi:membrane protease YdiL (CAAX protease family)